MLRLRGKYEKLKRIAEKELSCSAHGMDHVMRVYATALRIAKSENKVDLDVLKAATLLHDIARAKEDDDATGDVCHAEESAKMSGKILKNFGYSSERIEKIKHCIVSHRYKTNCRPQTIEAKILFDADKLDALGAIMIMRAGMWIGRNNASIFPKMKLRDYVKTNLVGGKINGRIKDSSQHCLYYEFEIKNKKIPSLMFTGAGKKIAKERLDFNYLFLERLKKEAQGKM